MADVDLVIVVEENWRADIDRLAKILETKGLRIKETLPRFRTIIGTAEDSAADALKSVEGVEIIRPRATFQLTPMDEKVPQ